MSIDDVSADILLKIANLLTDEEYLLLSETSKKICFCLTYGCYSTFKKTNLRQKRVDTLIGQLMTLRRNPSSIKVLKNPPNFFKKEAVRIDPCAIRHIKEPSESVQLLAVSKNAFALRWIANPTEKVKYEAVKNEGISIQFIENPSFVLEVRAIVTNPNELIYIKTTNLRKLALWLISTTILWFY